MSSTTTHPLMQFRTAYLQAIAKCWTIPEYEKELIDDPAKELKNLGFENPWSLRIEMDSSKRGKWYPHKAGGWIGPDVVASLWLPPAPDWDQQAFALAKYYDEFPTFFGTKDYGEGAASSSLTQPYPLGMGQPQSFVEFGGVMLRFIAMYWSDSALREELEQHAEPRRFRKEAMKVVKDGILFLHKWVGYNVPWNMGIEFNLTYPGPDPSKDSPKAYRWNRDDQTWGRPRPEVCLNGLALYVPEKPPCPGIEAVALSAYNATGDQYPFSCP
jgi:ribosomally synthesized peptide (two-chain TOMM family)